MELIRTDTKYILLGMRFEVILTQYANHRHSPNCIHLHAPLLLIMSHNQCPFKYFDYIYVKQWFTTISLKTICVIIIVL